MASIAEGVRLLRVERRQRAAVQQHLAGHVGLRGALLDAADDLSLTTI